MAKYTTQLRSIVESGINVFDFDYPIFDISYRPILEQKIIDYYYFREIGLETVEQFKHFLKNKMNLIMPLYNDHYLAYEKFKDLDPYENKNITVTESRNTTQDTTNESESSVDGTSNTNQSQSADGREVFSDTPQGPIINDNYATNVTETEGSTTNSQESNDSSSGQTKTTGVMNSTDDYLQTVRGFDGMKYASDVYKDLRDVFINIDQLIIDELSDLFMNVY